MTDDRRPEGDDPLAGVPLKVVFVPHDDSVQILDGRHRIEAHRRLGEEDSRDG